MAEGADEAGVVDEKCARHLEAVALEGTDEVAAEHAGDEAAEPKAWAKELRERAALKFQSRVETLLGIGDAGDVGEVVLGKEGGGAGVVIHVDEADGRGAFDLCASRLKIRKRFAAEGAAQVPEENDQNRTLVRQVTKRHAGVGLRQIQRGGEACGLRRSGFQ